MSRTALYRHFDAAGGLLYVGISNCLSNRDKQHAKEAKWHKDVTNSKTEWFDCRDLAIAAERKAIAFEAPIHNIRGAVARDSMLLGGDCDDQRIDVLGYIRANGETVAGIARKAGISRPTLYRVAAGKPTSTDTVRAIADALDVPVALVMSVVMAGGGR